MLISHRKRFIYLKTVKTAGTSVESYFEKYCMPEGEWEFSSGREEYESSSGIIGQRTNNAKQLYNKFYNHMSALEVKNAIDDDVWDSYFKFCVIRNPFDKMISGFYFAFRDMELNEPIKQFRDWLVKKGGINDRRVYTIENKLCLDYYIRYERLHEGIEFVCNKIGAPYEEGVLPRLKNEFRKNTIPIADYYDDKSIEIVERNYAFELENFGYSFNDVL